MCRCGPCLVFFCTVLLLWYFFLASAEGLDQQLPAAHAYAPGRAGPVQPVHPSGAVSTHPAHVWRPGLTTAVSHTAAGSYDVCPVPGFHDLIAAASEMQSQQNGSASLDAEDRPPLLGGVCAEPYATAAEAAAAAVKPAEDIDEDIGDDRHNFASAKDGAKVLAANKEAKHASKVLDNDGDTFMRSDCKHDKWLILELPQIMRPNILRVRISWAPLCRPGRCATVLLQMSIVHSPASEKL